MTPDEAQEKFCIGLLELWRTYGEDHPGYGLDELGRVDRRHNLERPSDHYIDAIYELLERLASLLQVKPIDEITIGEVPEAAVARLALLRHCYYHPVDYRIESTVEDLIKEIRRLGVSWRRIGEAMDMSPQGAFNKVRYHPDDEEAPT